MTINLVTLQPLVALVAGILILRDATAAQLHRRDLPDHRRDRGPDPLRHSLKNARLGRLNSTARNTPRSARRSAATRGRV